MSGSPLPIWLQTYWQRWYTMLEQERLPHALVLGGIQGLGKKQLALHMCALLLCNKPSVVGACGACKSCSLFQAQSHPDIKILEPEAPGKAILVDSTREIQPWLASTAQQGGNKVVLIEPANDMNVNSANALLKNLEEPGRGTYFILLHHWPKPLLPTIRSRCQQMEISIPDARQTRAWLQENHPSLSDSDAEQVRIMARGAPLIALDYLAMQTPKLRRQILVDLTALLRNQTNPSAVAEAWIKQSVQQILDWWIQWTQDLIRLLQTENVALVVNQDVIKLLQAVAIKAQISRVYGLYDELLDSSDNIRQRRNINQQLMLEKLLSDWYSLI